MFDRIAQGLYWDKPLTLVSGCNPCSPGCTHCWALAMEKRFRFKEYGEFGGWLRKNDTGILIHPERLTIPLKRKKPTVWAIWNDLFHEDVPSEFCLKAINQIASCPQHIFLILTKRIKRMNLLLVDREINPNNAWPGVTICNQPEADEKIPLLLQIPAAVRWVSIEPMLGPVSFRWMKWISREHSTGHLDILKGINGVVLGGETGPGARPLHPDWVRSIRDQCIASGTKFFFKQWGEWAVPSQIYGATMLSIYDGNRKMFDPKSKNPVRFGRKAAGRLLDGQEWNELPEIK